MKPARKCAPTPSAASSLRIPHLEGLAMKGSKTRVKVDVFGAPLCRMRYAYTVLFSTTGADVT